MVKLFSLLAIGFILAGECVGQVFMTKDEALKSAFGSAARERKTAFLTDEQVRGIEKLSRAKVDSRIITYYVGRTDTGLVGTTFFETHTVRTMPETFMLVVNPDGSVRLTELLAFYEPEDYKPPARWLEQFAGRKLSDDLWLKRGIRSISGATLTSQTLVSAVRRLLAVYEIVVRKGQE